MYSFMNVFSSYHQIRIAKEDHHKKTSEVHICVDLRKLNNACMHDQFPTPFTNIFLEGVGGQEMYSFTYGFSGYHQIRIVKEDHHKTTFVAEWGYF